MLAATHLFSFIWDECNDWPCISLVPIRKKFEGAGHIYRTWPFKRMLKDLIRAGLVEISSDNKPQPRH